MNHTHAFRCAQCPRNSDPERGPSCPAWWEWTAENVQTGESRIERMCGWQAMPRFLTEVIKASNRPAAEIGACRNEIVNGLTSIAVNMNRAVARLGTQTAPALSDGGSDGGA